MYLYYKQESKLSLRLPFGGHGIPWKRLKIGPLRLCGTEQKQGQGKAVHRRDGRQVEEGVTFESVLPLKRLPVNL